MQNEFSVEQQKRLLERLTIPFHPDAISWRVTNKSKDGKRGCVIPYGDQRAYTDRQIVPVEVSALCRGGGGIHCITQQEPVRVTA